MRMTPCTMRLWNALNPIWFMPLDTIWSVNAATTTPVTVA